MKCVVGELSVAIDEWIQRGGATVLYAGEAISSIIQTS